MYRFSRSNRESVNPDRVGDSTTELRWNDSHRIAGIQFVHRMDSSKSFPKSNSRRENWLRGLDLNQRPSGYEPDELPGCSTPRDENRWDINSLQIEKTAPLG